MAARPRRLFLALLAVLCLGGSGCLAQDFNNPACPACKNGGTCVKEFNSPVYSCNCTNTGFNNFLCDGTLAPSSDALVTLPSAAAPSPSETNIGVIDSPAAPSQSRRCTVDCVNGACRSEQNTPAYKCVCYSGWDGPACNLTIAPAAATPEAASPEAASAAATTSSACLGCSPVGGRCQRPQDSQGFECVCLAGYEGPFCLTQTATSPSTGPAAATPTSPASPAATCLNCVNGKCRIPEDSSLYVCACSVGWSGPNCTMPETAASNVSGSTTQSGGGQSNTGSLKGWEVFAICLAVIVGVVLIGSAGIILWKRRGRKATFVKFNDSTLEPQQIEVLEHR